MTEKASSKDFKKPLEIIFGVIVTVAALYFSTQALRRRKTYISPATHAQPVVMITPTSTTTSATIPATRMKSMPRGRASQTGVDRGGVTVIRTRQIVLLTHSVPPARLTKSLHI